MSSVITDQIVGISRFQKDANNSNKESYVPNLALQAVACQIQPASPTDTAIAAGIFGQTFLMFTTQSGIFPGDRVTISGTGQVMRVRGIEDWSFIEQDPHYEITLIRFEEDTDINA